MSSLFEQFLQLTGEVGNVTYVTNAIAHIEGLPSVKPGEVVIFETGQIGFILGLLPDRVEAIFLSAESVAIGSRVTNTQKLVSLPAQTIEIGQMIKADTLEYLITLALGESAARPLTAAGAPFAERQKIIKPLTTGIALIDLLLPLAKGQREVVVGDHKSGKTQFVIDLLRYVISTGSKAIYVVVGKSQREIEHLITRFEADKLNSQMVVVATSPIDGLGMTFLAPFVGMTLAEVWRQKGEDVTIVIDDLSAHARYYREMMLLAGRFPGRSSYPGDMFFTHARLLERAGNFQNGSITCLPMVQTTFNDLTGYIQTNIMSMTDGHILLDRDLLDQGQLPPIRTNLSVTRVGTQVQSELLRDTGRAFRQLLVNFERTKEFRHFQTDVSEKVRLTLQRGQSFQLAFNQQPGEMIPPEVMLLVCAAIWLNYWYRDDADTVHQKVRQLVNDFETKPEFRQLLNQISGDKKSFANYVEAVQNQAELFAEEKNQTVTA